MHCAAQLFQYFQSLLASQSRDAAGLFGLKPAQRENLASLQTRSYLLDGQRFEFFDRLSG